jgi:hypothetical protein
MLGSTAASAVQQELPRLTVTIKFAKKEIAMNNPERLNEDPPDSQHSNKLLAQQPADELMELEATHLQQVAGGGDGTVIGVGKN